MYSLWYITSSHTKPCVSLHILNPSDLNAQSKQASDQRGWNIKSFYLALMTLLLLALLHLNFFLSFLIALLICQIVHLLKFKCTIQFNYIHKIMQLAADSTLEHFHHPPKEILYSLAITLHFLPTA